MADPVRLHHAGRELSWTCPKCAVIVGETFVPVDPSTIGMAVALFSALGYKNPKAWKRYPNAVSCPKCEETFAALCPTEPRPKNHRRRRQRPIEDDDCS